MFGMTHQPGVVACTTISEQAMWKEEGQITHLQYICAAAKARYRAVSVLCYLCTSRRRNNSGACADVY